MEVQTLEVKSNLRDELLITSIGDVHGGSANCNKQAFRKKVKEIADADNQRWIGLGDYCEWISHTDQRFDPDNLDDEIVDIHTLKNLRGTYVDWIVEELWPIRDKCLAFGEGNHEEKFSSRNAGNMAWDIAEKLGVPYTGWASLTELVFRDGNKHGDSFTIYAAHGWQAGRKSGGISNSLEDLMGWMEADIYFQGHSHHYQCVYAVGVNKPHGRNTVEHRTKVGWHTGSFLKTYQVGTVSYSERKQYRPNVLWTPTVTVHPMRGEHGWCE